VLLLRRRPLPRTRRCAARKNEAWLSHTRPQGGTSIPISSEVGGRQGEQASALLGKICMSAGGSLSDRTAFKVYALQRLHAATFRGVAAMTNARPIWHTGPGFFPGKAASPRGPAVDAACRGDKADVRATTRGGNLPVAK